ncbi:kinesin-like protein KIF6 isoform X2 [Physella acuta]|uniref:kinesin-like protein KIF6 isoform X2 n=1 Tax=Physella acuta TaxID=109671 RepID=UPI0027DD7C90|nr:kinesin-like protein KIF6 isoform X2 [Physella acuta]
MAQIKTYARLKPSKKAYPGYEIGKNVLTVHIPDNKDFLLQGPQQPIRSNLSYDIVFTDIFRPEVTQEAVFDGVAKDIIQNFLNGYNGTIFAYGQTGTGKTYTVEGNSSRYNTRGLATRALSMIYQQLENRTDEHISVYLSYLEIYQEVAYDLLNPAARSSLPVAPFAKVTVVEGPRGSCILRGLSLHLAANEEIAQMLLLQGQANRKVAETPVNQRSSRSHAVFTVYLQVRKHDSEVLVNSKLHLVDLAGSERVSKTGVDGQQLTEAKSINLSLHHLETVIIALQSAPMSSSHSASEKSKGENPALASRSNTSFTSGPSCDGSRPFKFVPYRNSLLTMVLKDSLGGNCLTAMIATISLEPENLGESISTCRFAQRVARIANNARRNEEVDDKTLIRRLKQKVAYLENQVALLRSKGRNEQVTEDNILDELTEEDRMVCAKIMEGFLQGVITDPVDAGICDQCRFRECLHLLKHQCLQKGSVARPPKAIPPEPQQDLETTPDHSDITQPNNPHRDSGDHVMNTTSQGTSPITNTGLSIAESKCPQTRKGLSVDNESSSEVTLHSSHDVYNNSAYLDQAEGGLPPAEAVKKTKKTIEELMDSIKKEDKLTSSYNKKQEFESKKLSRKLSKLDQPGHPDGTELVKNENILQELIATENSLSLKLQATEEQLRDRHAFIGQLKHMQADPDLITKEQLVEKHLLRRKAKIQDKLNSILMNKSRFEQNLPQQFDSSLTSSHVSSKMSLDEISGQHKQGKGVLNTREVFDLLRAEEEKQQKEFQSLENLKPQRYDSQLHYNTCPYQNSLTGEAQPPADRNGSQSREIAYPHEVHSADDQVKRLQEYLDQVLNGAYIDKFYESRHGHGSMRSPKAALEPRENFGACSPRLHAGLDPLANNVALLNEGIMPTEVRSLHDPRHSHKFALDDRPCESSSLVTPEKNNIESLYKNSNNNANNKPKHYMDGSSTVLFSSPPSKILKSSEPADFPLTLSDLQASANPSQDTNMFHNKIFSKKQEENETLIHATESLEYDDSYFNDMNSFTEQEPIIDSLEETVSELGLKFGSSSRHLRKEFVLTPSQYINSMGTSEKFDARKMGLTSGTFESTLSNMLKESSELDGSRLIFETDPYEKFARVTKLTETNVPSSNKPSSPSLSEDSEKRNSGDVKKKRFQSSPDHKGYPSVTTHSMRQLPSQNKALHIGKKNKKANETSVDTFESKLALFKNSTHVYDDDDDDVNEDTFFGLQPEKTKLTAMSTEEGERTFMSTVAAEKARIEKIRKARWAAEVIQRHWRKFRVRE